MCAVGIGSVLSQVREIRRNMKISKTDIFIHLLTGQSFLRSTYYDHKHGLERSESGLDCYVACFWIKAVIYVPLEWSSALFIALQAVQHSKCMIMSILGETVIAKLAHKMLWAATVPSFQVGMFMVYTSNYNHSRCCTLFNESMWRTQDKVVDEEMNQVDRRRSLLVMSI